MKTRPPAEAIAPPWRRTVGKSVRERALAAAGSQAISSSNGRAPERAAMPTPVFQAPGMNLKSSGPT